MPDVAAYADREVTVSDGRVRRERRGVSGNVPARPAADPAQRQGSPHRLMVTSAARSRSGVAIMLAVLADFHAFEVTGNRPFWEGTQAVAAGHQRSGQRPSCGTTATRCSGARRSSGSTSRRSGAARRCRPASPGCPAAGSTTPRRRWRRCSAACRATSWATAFPGSLAGPDRQRGADRPRRARHLRRRPGPRSWPRCPAPSGSTRSRPRRASRSGRPTSGTRSSSARSPSCSRSSS